MSAGFNESDVLPSLAAQNRSISSTLNTIMVQQFLFGIYSGMFATITYTYYHGKRDKISPNWIIIGTVATLYILTTIVVLLDWEYMDLVFCDYVYDRLSVYEVATQGPLLSFSLTYQKILLNIAQFGGLILADGLLVWRCFHACGSSFCRACLPIGLLMVEAGLIICAMFYSSVPAEGAPDEKATIRSLDLSVPLAGSSLVSAAVTSLVSTFMICRQVYRCYPSIHSSSRRSRYKRLLLTLIQSSGAYSVTVSVKAIIEFFDKGYIPIPLPPPPYAGEVLQFPVSTSYSAVIINVIVGLVPTLMVASVSLSRSHNNNEVFSESFSFPLDIDLGEPQFAT
ncbi:hypothetical protein CPC08DRAFT_717796, partial [Agrocybe pediades]